MKKAAAIILLSALILTFTSCAVDENSSSAITPPVSTAPESEAVSEETSDEPASVEPYTYIASLDALLGDEPDRTLNRKNVLSGSKYTSSRVSGEGDTYRDKNFILLTDGNIATDFNGYTWTGYAGKKDVTIDFDLGKTVAGIADFEVHTIKYDDYGIGLPAYVTLFVSEDGENYIEAGKIITPTDLLKVQEYTYRFCLQGMVSARYIRFYFAEQDNVWFFLDEISAYVYGEGESKPKTVGNYYGCDQIEKSEPVYWDKSSANYDKNLNLAENSKVYIYSFAEIAADSATENLNTPADSGIMTDGKFGKSPSFYESDLHRFTRGDGRKIVLDLGFVSAVSSIKGEAISQEDWGVQAPDKVVVSVSENGADWFGVAEYDLKGSGFIKFGGDLDKTYKARFVSFTFRIITHSAFSELQVYGSKNIPANAVSAGITDLNRYKTKDDVGIDNVLCLPISSGTTYGGYGDFGMSTKEDLLQYAGYYEDGVLKDTFMDTFVFSPCSAYVEESNRHTLAGWKHYLNAQFESGVNLEALSSAVDEIGSGLSIENYKANIVFSIMRTYKYADEDSKQINTFGDIDGDGKDDSFDNIENRKKAIKWLVDTQIEEFKRKNYTNLNLWGFYWHEEYIVDTDPDEIVLLKYALDYVHSLGLKVMWIPFYNAVGYNRWKEFGIDLACLQPNYSFMTIEQKDRLDSASELAKMYSMCVEIEISDPDNVNNIKKYKEYLAKGVEKGYMNAVKVYYQGVIPGDFIKARSSSNAYTNSVYRDTYLYAKGKLDSSYSPYETGDIIKAENLTCDVKPGKTFTGKIENSSQNICVYEITQSPKYGAIRLNNDGTFTYIPPKTDFVTDVFKVKAVYSYGESEETVITLNSR